MAKWGQKWKSFVWGSSVPADSTTALLRAIVGGAASWVPAPVDGAPNGGDPATGTALYRHAETRAYLIDEDWNDITELVGIIDGSRSSSLSGWYQTDAVSLILYDYSNYYTSGAGSPLIQDGKLLRIETTVSSPGGTVVLPMGKYRLKGLPSVKTDRTGSQITLNAVEWYQDGMNAASTIPMKIDPPAWMGAPAVSAYNPPPWPTTGYDLGLFYNYLLGLSDWTTWAESQFENQREVDGDPVWLAGPLTRVAGLWWWFIHSYYTDVVDRLILDKNVRDPFSSRPLSGQFQDTRSLGPEFLLRRPEYRDVFGVLASQFPFYAVTDGSGNIHLRANGLRYISQYTISNNPSSGGTIAIPIENISHTPNQPEYTIIRTYTQINPQTGTSGKTLFPGTFILRSESVVPDRFRRFGDRIQVIIYETYDPPVVDDGVPVVSSGISAPPFSDDGTSLARYLEIMAAADQISVDTDSAFPFITLGDEIRVDVPGLKGYYTVSSINQPFNVGPQNITLSWRAD